MNDGLPDGWVVGRVGDVTEHVPNTKPEEEPQREFGYIDISAIDNSNFTITDVKRFRGNEAPSRARRPVQPNDILFSNVRTYLRNVALVESDCPAKLCSTGFTVLRPNGAVEPRYLFRYVLTDDFIDRVSPQQTGTHYPATSDRVVMAEQIPLAPIDEQRRIVTKIEALVAKVRSSQERLDKIPTIIKRFRQAVLAAACAGTLTADWRKTHTAAGSGFQGSSDAEGLGELPDTWQWTTVAAMCSSIVDCPHSTPRWAESGRICVRTTNFRPGHLDLAEVRFVSKQTYRERVERLTPKPGDILYSREGGILGIACMVPAGVDLCLGQRMMLFRVSHAADATFLMNWLNSPLILRRVVELTGGSASPHLNVGDIKDFPAPLPPPAEQREIVRRTKELFGLANRLEARYVKAKAQVDRLTQSVLAKAFRGELVTTEAELARREGREYETAGELLGRIKAAPAAPKGNANAKRLAGTKAHS